MALSAAIIWELRTAGADTNGGGFKAGATGTDWSQQNAAQYSVTDGVAAGTTTITSATANFGTDVVGNVMYVAGGTGTITAGWYEITARTNSTTITVDRSTGLTAGTGVTLIIGGALLSPGLVTSLLVADQSVYQKAGTYAITSATPNIVGGCVSSAVRVKLWEGYQTVRGDLGTPPVMQASGISTATLFKCGSQGDSTLRNFTLDGATLASITGMRSEGRQLLHKIKGINCTNNGFSNNGSFVFHEDCLATGCTTVSPAFQGLGVFLRCEASGNAVSGFDPGSSNAVYLFCISTNNSGATSDGFSTSNNVTFYLNPTSYGNGRDGIRIAASAVTIINGLAEANTGYGANNVSSSTGCALFNFGTYNNTAGAINGTFALTSSLIPNTTGTFFTDPSSGNFSLNNSANQGALARATGIPGVFLDGLTTGYLDLGAAQHADPASSGGNTILAGSGQGLVIH